MRHHSASSNATTSTKKLLIVADESASGARIAEIARTLRYDITEVCGAATALKLATACRPDIVLMSLDPKAVSEYIAAARDFRLSHQIPVVFITQETDDTIIEAANAADPFGFITEPWTTPQINIVLEMALYRHQAEQEIRRLTSNHAMLSHVNQTIFQVASPEALFETVCRLVVEYGSFKMAWIGRIDANTGAVKCLAQTGDYYNFLQSIEILPNSQPDLLDPAGKAVRYGRSTATPDFNDAPEELKWKDAAAASGFRSGAGIPLRNQSGVWGVLAVYAAERAYFQANEMDLLEELARNIMLVLKRLESETQHQRSEEELRKSEENFRMLFENAVEGIFLSTKEGRFLTVNPAFARMYGYATPEQMVREVTDIPRQLYPKPDQRLTLFRQAMEHGKVENFEIEGLRRDGQHIWVSLNAHSIYDKKGNLLVLEGTSIDVTERKKTKEALQQAHHRVVSILESMTDGLLAYDHNWRCVYANATAEQILGKDREDLLGVNHWELFPTASGSDFENTHRRAMQEREVLEHESYFPAWDRWFYLKIYPSEEGGVSINFRDITERKQAETELHKHREQLEEMVLDRTSELLEKNRQLAQEITERTHIEEALREREARIRSIVETAVDGIITIDESGIIESFNPAAERIFGYATTEVIGQNIRMLMSPGHRAIYEDHLPHHPQNERGRLLAVGREVTGLTKNGRLFPMELSVAKLTLTGHKLFTGIVRDITERRRAEEQLRKLWRAIENSPVSVVITDKNGVIEYVNPRFCGVSGYAAEEAIGQNPRVLKSGAHSPDFYEALWSTISLGNTWRGEMCNQSKSGELYWEFVSISPVRNSQGQITHFVAIKEDITEQKQVAKELQRAKEAAETANRAKSAFLANMSHEIRTPMNAILGFSQLLQRDPHLTLQQHQYLETINRSGEHLLAIINDVLEMSKIEAGRTTLNPVTFDFPSLLSDLESIFRVRAEEKGVMLDFVHAQEIPRYLVADMGKIRQVLVNLLGNAVKFTNQGQVELRVAATVRNAEQVNLVIEVSDTGPGIAPEEINLLFQNFQQTEAGRMSGTGTGLGLAISHEFVRLMGGSLTVSSELNRGSTFRVEVVAGVGSEAAYLTTKTDERQVQKLKSASPCRILVVDDKEDNRKLLRELLGRIGFHVLLASDGAEALRLVQSHSPHLLLTDMRMPVMDGYALIRQLRSTGANLKIVSLTAGAFDEERKKAIEVGADAFIGKPFRESELFETIRKLIGVEYTYIGPTNPSPSSSGRPSNFGVATIAKLPPDLVHALKVAVEIADSDQLLDLIPRVEQHNPPAARAIAQMAENFDFRSLAKLLSL